MPSDCYYKTVRFALRMVPDFIVPAAIGGGIYAEFIDPGDDDPHFRIDKELPALFLEMLGALLLMRALTTVVECYLTIGKMPALTNYSFWIHFEPFLSMTLAFAGFLSGLIGVMKTDSLNSENIAKSQAAAATLGGILAGLIISQACWLLKDTMAVQSSVERMNYDNISDNTDQRSCISKSTDLIFNCVSTLYSRCMGCKPGNGTSPTDNYSMHSTSQLMGGDNISMASNAV